MDDPVAAAEARARQACTKLGRVITRLRKMTHTVDGAWWVSECREALKDVEDAYGLLTRYDDPVDLLDEMADL